MNSSAKFIFTLMGAAALGALAFACTVGSSTDDDTRGGSSTSSSSSSSSSGASSSSSSSSGSAEAGALCEKLTLPLTRPIESVECDTCLRTNCCDSVAAAFNLADDEVADTKVGTINYVANLNLCDQGDPDANPPVEPADDPDECKRVSGTLTRDGVVAAYGPYLSCRIASCTAACDSDPNALPPPDAGTKN
jgi:hypothetical protein